MPIWNLQTSIGGDSALPRDRAVITPHFDDGGLTSDPQQLCDDLADALAPYFLNDREVIVRAYDAQGTAPVYPEGEAVRNPGGNPVSGYPREVAICLSFYSARNIPRQRGRLYIPLYALGGTIGVRPAPTNIAKVMELGPIFADLGDASTDWVVYSRSDDVARPVTNYWVDDEWDTIRSRGLRSTTRSSGTTSEA